jgi:hypothetical protein
MAKSERNNVGIKPTTSQNHTTITCAHHASLLYASTDSKTGIAANKMLPDNIESYLA